MDPSTWQNLPRDIIYHIISHSDLPTRIAFSCTSWEFSPYASSLIWRSIHLHNLAHTTAKANFINHYSGEYRNFHSQPSLARPRSPTRKFHVTETGFTNHTPTMPPNQKFTRGHIHTSPALPSAWIKTLSINNRTHRCSHSTLLTILLPLSHSTPALSTLSYDGPLYQKSLNALTTLPTLRSLSLRLDPTFSSGLWQTTSTAPSTLMPENQMVLDFTPISQLPLLRSLQIGRLLQQEAISLAKAVAKLPPLESLEVGCGPYEFISCARHGYEHFFEWTLRSSPLISFLEGLQGEGSAIEGCEGGVRLPRGLKSFVVEDGFRAGMPNVLQLLAGAVRGCEGLVRLGLAVRREGGGDGDGDGDEDGGVGSGGQEQVRTGEVWRRFARAVRVERREGLGRELDGKAVRYSWSRVEFEELLAVCDGRSFREGWRTCESGVGF